MTRGPQAGLQGREARWTMRSILPRVAQHGDLFAPAQADLQELPPLG